MYRFVHVFIGFSLGLYLGTDLMNSIIYAFIGALGGYVPDIDLRFKHRKTLHNIFSLLISCILIYLVLKLFLNQYFLSDLINARFIILSFDGGWLLHILLDSLTVRGVYIFYPLSNIRLRIPLFKSDSTIGNTLSLFLGFIFVYGWMVKTGLWTYVEVFLRYIDELLKT